MNRLIIGIAGKKRSGKDTAAKFLADSYGFTQVSFAKPIKQHLYILNPWVKSNDGFTTIRYQAIIDSIGEDRAKEEYREIRRLQQVYGTEVIRDEFGSNAWIDLAFKRIEEKKLEKVVISDVRFPNEVTAILQKPFSYLIKIKSDRVKSLDKHASEQDLPDDYFNVLIDNNGTIEEFLEKIKTSYESFSQILGQKIGN